MLKNPPAFWNALRAGLLGPTLSQDEVLGVQAILDAWEGAPITFVAYGLGTTYLETSHSMQPIKEFGGYAYFMRMYDKTGNRPDVAKRLGNTEVGDGAKFPGMGYVQCTGRGNAKRAGLELSLPIEEHPELLMRPDIAANVMRLGMTEGWFTGRKLSDFLPKAGVVPLADFIRCRSIINGTDRQTDVATYAFQFQMALSAGGWA